MGSDEEMDDDVEKRPIQLPIKRTRKILEMYLHSTSKKEKTSSTQVAYECPGPLAKINASLQKKFFHKLSTSRQKEYFIDGRHIPKILFSSIHMPQKLLDSPCSFDFFGGYLGTT